MKKARPLIGMLLLLLVFSFTGVLFAAEAGNNVSESTYTKNGKTYECLISDDGYLQITQIVPNSQKVKINTYVEDNKLLISGTVNKGTEVTIKVFNEGDDKDTVYPSLESAGTFAQSVEIPEGKNKIIVAYNNKKGNIEDYVSFNVTRASKQSIDAIKNFLVTA